MKSMKILDQPTTCMCCKRFVEHCVIISDRLRLCPECAEEAHNLINKTTLPMPMFDLSPEWKAAAEARRDLALPLKWEHTAPEILENVRKVSENIAEACFKYRNSLIFEILDEFQRTCQQPKCEQCGAEIKHESTEADPLAQRGRCFCNSTHSDNDQDNAEYVD